VSGAIEQQYVDPNVSRRKFDQQLADYRVQEQNYRARGWFLIEASFPKVFVVMAAPQLAPPPLITGVHLDYTNYDARPPSVRLVNPFTSEPYRAHQLPTRLVRRKGEARLDTPDGPQLEVTTLMQGDSPQSLPFLCLPGVREYHDHPGHSGDPWELHRRTGAGTLVRLLEVIHIYGIAPLTGWQVNLNPEVSLASTVPPL
jgi:Predicted metal binding domain